MKNEDESYSIYKTKRYKEIETQIQSYYNVTFYYI